VRRRAHPLLLAGLVALLAGLAWAGEPPAAGEPGAATPAPAEPGTPQPAAAAAPLQDWELEALSRLELLENLELLEALDVVEDLGVLDGSGGEP
jgi:hypothetical protein